MSAALLAKMTAKGLVITSEGFGGTVHISAQDVAGSLSGLYRNAYLFILAKYTADPAATKELQFGDKDNPEDIGMVGMVFIDCHKQGWKCDLERAHKITQLVLFQTIGGYLCPTCDGNGGTQTKICPRCNGNGKGSMRKSDKARMMDMKSQPYGERWDSRIKEFEAIVNQWESDGISHLWEQWKEEAA